jgi:hypothetical protein
MPQKQPKLRNLKRHARLYILCSLQVEAARLAMAVLIFVNVDAMPNGCFQKPVDPTDSTKSLHLEKRSDMENKL